MVTERGASAGKRQGGSITRYDNRFGAPSYRTSGNTAHKLQQEEAPAPVRSKRSQPVSKAGLSIGARILLTLFVVMVFGMGCVIITRQSMIVQTGKQITALKEQIRQQEKHAEDLKLELASATDINTIMQEASARLGMGYPQEGQVRAFTLPQPTPNVLQSAQEQPVQSEGRFGFLGVLLGLLR